MQQKIDVALVQNLIASQIPQWKNLPISPVVNGGWDNRTFHLGKSMLIRIPSAERYAQKIEKEFRWLPILSPLLSYNIPKPLVMGKPDETYPWNWGVYTWIEGETVASCKNIDLNQFAHDLALFLKSFHTIDIAGGPEAGAHNFYRGGSLQAYDAEVQQAITILKNKIDVELVKKIWKEALTNHWHHDPVWVHGDIAAGNLLVQHGKLTAVIDFGGLAIGDPACDLAIAWTLFKNESRETFKHILSFDSDTWLRGQAWALWKALIIAADITQTNASEGKQCWYIIDTILKDNKRAF